MNATLGRPALALAGFFAGAVFAGVSLTVHLLINPEAMLSCTPGGWWSAVVGSMAVGTVAGLAGAAVGWWLGSRPCPFHHP